MSEKLIVLSMDAMVSEDIAYLKTKPNFSRLFKKQTGYTFTEYLTSCRIDLACRLLKETELKVSDIAAESGFSDRTKFYKVFSEKMGMTPKHYRKSKT